MDPEGAVVLEGFGRYKTYYKSMLDKFGIKVHVFKVGKFKSAVEPFLLDQMSEPAKEANLRWLGVLWDAYKVDVSKSRNIGLAELEAYINDFPALLKAASGNTAKIAVDNKLIDSLQNDIEFNAMMVKQVGENKSGKSYKKVAMKTYLETVRSPFEIYDDSTQKVALITAKGTIMDGEQVEGNIGGKTLAELIRKARTDDTVKAVVLRVDSGGGSAFASEMIRREIVATKAAGKKFVVSMGTLAASGGYWISADADEIWARPTTITGSIGIFGMFPTIEKPLAELGIHRDGVGTAPLAGAFNIASPLAPELGELIQETINHGYDNFLTIVANGRNMTKEEVDKIAQGRVWAGTDALKLGLVDKLGSLQDAIDSAATMAGIRDNYELYQIKRELTEEEKLIQKFFATVDLDQLNVQHNQSNIASRITGFAKAELDKLASFNDPNGVYANCMCDTEN
jgi:protease-4